MPDRRPNTHKQVGDIYLIGQVIKAGNPLSTYTAYNRNTNDVVGISVMEIPPTMPPQTAQQFLQPLAGRRTLQSSHVLRVHDYGIDGTCIYIATDPPRGITLEQVMDTENIDIYRALDITKQLATGLKIFHDKGIAGLDLRPQLITVDTIGIDDRVQIDDIGLRPLFNALGYVNEDNPGFLDIRYTPPEYIQGKQISPWSDIYQLGLLLFTLITGRPPFIGQNQAETGMMQTNSPIPRMSQFSHGTPEALQEIVEHALARDHQERFSNAGAMLTVLEQVQLPLSPAQRYALYQSSKHPTTTATSEMQKIDADALQNPAHNKELLQAATAKTTDEVYAYLSYEQDGVELQRLVITQPSVIIGRSDPKRSFIPDIDISLLDPRKTVSRQHARIHYEKTFFYIEDLKSRNKTRLRESPLDPLKPELVQHGDVLHFGSVRVRFGIPTMGKLPEMKERK